MTKTFIAYLIEDQREEPIYVRAWCIGIGATKEEAIAKTKEKWLDEQIEDDSEEYTIDEHWEAISEGEPDAGWFLQSHEV